MKVSFAQPDFPYAERTVGLVKRVAAKLSMESMLSSVMIDVIDYGAPVARDPADCIEVYSNGGVRLHLHLNHFLLDAKQRGRGGGRQVPQPVFQPLGVVLQLAIGG